MPIAHKWTDCVSPLFQVTAKPHVHADSRTPGTDAFVYQNKSCLCAPLQPHIAVCSSSTDSCSRVIFLLLWWDVEQTAEQWQSPSPVKIRPCAHDVDINLHYTKLEPVVLGFLATVHPHSCSALQLAQALWPEQYAEGNHARAQLTRFSMQIKVAHSRGCSCLCQSLHQRHQRTWSGHAVSSCQQRSPCINRSCGRAVEQCRHVLFNHLLPKRLVKVQCPGGVWTYQTGAKRLEV